MEKKESGSGASRKLLNLTYAYDNYEVDGSIYIEALENGELYAVLTINLSGYGIRTGENLVILKAYEMSPELLDTVIHDLVEEVIVNIHYGPFDAWGLLVRLKNDWRERAVSLESLYQTDNER